VSRAVQLMHGLPHRPSVRYPDHQRRLQEFIRKFGLEEHLSSLTTGWCSSTVAHVRLNGTGLRFWADSCSLNIKVQVFGSDGFLLSGVRFFDLTKTEEEKIRREIEKIIKKALPEPTKRPRKRT
jgi:hypothetical protein